MTARKPAAKPTPAKKNTAIARRGSTAVATNDALSMLTEHAGQGLNDIRSEHLAIPFLSILQDNSKAVKKKSEEYITGAEPGLFVYSLDNALLEEVTCVMFHFNSNVVEWYDRKLNKQGFVAAYPDMETAVQAKRASGRADTVLTTTHNHMILFQHPETEDWVPAMFPCASTKLTPSKKWVAVAKAAKLPNGAACPIYGMKYRLTPKFESKNGNDYWNFEVTCEGLVDDPDLIKSAIQYASGFESGKVQVNYAAGGDGETDDIDSM